eukprot:SAG31_NODE_33_length_32018_cov_69.763088_17_plen_636_part_00
MLLRKKAAKLGLLAAAAFAVGAADGWAEVAAMQTVPPASALQPAHWGTEFWRRSAKTDDAHAPVCALVITADGDDRTTPLWAFCADSSSAAGSTCSASLAAHQQGGPARHLTRACDSYDPHLYVQQAIYAATNRDRNGHRQPPNSSIPAGRRTVLLSAGAHVLDTAQACWYPFGAWTVLHLPSNCSLSGSSGGGGSVLKLDAKCVRLGEKSGAACASASSPLDNLILISDYRVGAPTLSTEQFLAPAVNVALVSVAIEPSATANLVNAVAAQGSSVQIASVNISRGAAAAISLGYFSQFIPANPADRTNISCATDGWCRGKVMPLVNATVTGCRVTAGLQGVTVIGTDVAIVGNQINLTEQTWISPASVFGIGMGVSAGFVGSANVAVVGNHIQGGDYSVGADGSFPLLMSAQLFAHHWPAILTYYPAWKAKYPGGPVAANGKLLLRGNDFVLAGQVLLDMASKYHATATDEPTYDAGFNRNLTVRGNVLSGAVCGVSLYRTRSSSVSGNTIRAASSSLSMYGVELGASHNNRVENNTLIGQWRVGLLAEGAGVDDPRGCGPCQAHLGAARNVFSRNTALRSLKGIVLGLNTDCGQNNSVIDNNVTSCEWEKALATVADGNLPTSCNTRQLQADD